jgi:hypothetical protein
MHCIVYECLYIGANLSVQLFNVFVNHATEVDRTEVSTTWPKCCTCKTAYNANPHNAGCSEKPQLWHTKHASMMQMSIAGDLQAIIDAEAYSDAHSNVTKWDNAHEMKASAVEHMCEQEAMKRRAQRGKGGDGKSKSKPQHAT